MFVYNSVCMYVCACMSVFVCFFCFLNWLPYGEIKFIYIRGFLTGTLQVHGELWNFCTLRKSSKRAY